MANESLRAAQRTMQPMSLSDLVKELLASTSISFPVLQSIPRDNRAAESFSWNAKGEWENPTKNKLQSSSMSVPPSPRVPSVETVSFAGVRITQAFFSEAEREAMAYAVDMTAPEYLKSREQARGLLDSYMRRALGLPEEMEVCTRQIDNAPDHKAFASIVNLRWS